MKKTRYESVRDWRHNTKIRLFQAFGSKCACCGLVDEMVCYDFHHLDSSEKEYNITQKIRSWEATKIEAQKCCMLCAHCHRKLHAGFVKLPENYQLFDESLIDKRKTHDECPVCSAAKPVSQKTCSVSCGRRNRHIRDWDQVNLPELLAKYGNAYAISRQIGVSDVTVRRRLRLAGLI